MAKRKMHGSLFSKRLEVLGQMLDEQLVDAAELCKWEGGGKAVMRKRGRECKALADALTFALDVINELIPTEVAYEEWGAKLLELSLKHSKAADGSLLVYAAVQDYLACETPPHEPAVHVMRIKSDMPLGRHEPRTENNALWLDMIAGMECGYFGRVETVYPREPKALLTAGTEVAP